jgi:hypothetical protein
MAFRTLLKLDAAETFRVTGSVVVVVVEVVLVVVVTVEFAVLHDVVTSKRAIKPVVSSIRQRILFGDKFFKSSPFLSYAC